MLVRSTSGRTHHTGSMAVVDDQHGAELVADESKFIELAEIALHREDSIRDHPRHTGHVRIVHGLLKDLSQMRHVAVTIDRLVEPLLDHGGQTNAVDDAGVVELVADDDVARLAEGRIDGLIGRPAGDERIRGLDTEKVCDSRLETFVGIECAADESNGSRTGTISTKPSTPASTTSG